ncbi:MAG: bifunctional hydroxymethylpyrimidine kinase/phosphomethylpyrimidine kinase [Armatimonadetes bacterium]|nr:bifunctional hydroxymethylpyrimidine kinase/phosphomethylpyrimidine kinase [Armatimonadota bacterium]
MRVTQVPPVVLTIAGSDPSGGAGVQADLKTFTVLGVYGTAAITAITCQNTKGMSDYLPMPAQLVAAQITIVVEDIGCAAAKTGMLATAEIVRTVAKLTRELALSPLVVDPILRAHSGGTLLDEEGLRAMKDHLLPVATVVTPNAHEAAQLVGFPVDDAENAARAAQRLLEMGPGAVIIKGGHLREDAVDILVEAGKPGPLFLAAPRLEAHHTHGTGCIFSAALTAELSKGLPLEAAARRAKTFVTEAIRYGLALGQGRGPANVLAAGLMLPSW